MRSEKLGKAKKETRKRIIEIKSNREKEKKRTRKGETESNCRLNCWKSYVVKAIEMLVLSISAFVYCVCMRARCICFCIHCNFAFSTLLRKKCSIRNKNVESRIEAKNWAILMETIRNNRIVSFLCSWLRKIEKFNVTKSQLPWKSKSDL